MIKTLHVEGIRCFRERQRIPIRPITLLVGENSTGKTTLLAMVRAAWDIAFRREEPDFNEEPFDLGAYDAIAHHRGSRLARARVLCVGADVEWGGYPERTVLGTFAERVGQPVMSGLEVRQPGQTLRVSLTGDRRATVTLERAGRVPIDEVVDLPRKASIGRAPDLAVSAMLARRRGRRAGGVAGMDALGALWGDWAPVSAREGPPRPIAVAPVRSKPRRTRSVESDSVDAEEKRLIRERLCVSDDQHLIALARESGARLVCTEDQKLMRDVRSADLLNKPRGRIYRDARHFRLLHHDSCCRKQLSAAPPRRK
jgi:hypothetical protein